MPGNVRKYLVLDGVARHIPNEETYLNLFKDWKCVKTWS